MQIRFERRGDTGRIRAVVTAAFRDAPHSSGTEAAIVDALRDAGALAISLVAEEAGEIIGYVAFSVVTIDGAPGQWFGLGPVAVSPGRQRAGVGQALVQFGLDHLRGRGAHGCVVLGDPHYYRRFGFESDPRLRYDGVPQEYFQALAFGNEHPAGAVDYHQAFTAEAAEIRE